jgi:hypothetical protein
MKNILTLSIILSSLFSAFAQPQQIKHVSAIGGSIKKGTIYTSFSVVGQLANSEFSNGVYSGSIGYLDNGDNDPTNISSLIDNRHNIEIYPNPSTGNISIKIKTEISSPVTITVINSAGVLIFSKEYPANNSSLILLQGEMFAISGIYSIGINSEYLSVVRQITVIR